MDTLVDAGFGSLFWAFGGQPDSFADVPNRYRDEWMIDDALQGEGEIRSDPLRSWHEWHAAFPVIVEIAHSLDDSELRHTSERKWFELVIPGERYATRRIAMSSVSGKWSVTPYRNADRAIRATGILGSKLVGTGVASKATIRARQATQRVAVARSYAAYTDGSGLDYPVRKFIEIPAQGTLMFAYSPRTLERLGFVPQRHFVETCPEDLGQLIRDRRRLSSLYNDIRNRAFEFVAKEHTTTRRAVQFIAAMMGVAEGRVSSAKYESGKFTLEQ